MSPKKTHETTPKDKEPLKKQDEAQQEAQTPAEQASAQAEQAPQGQAQPSEAETLKAQTQELGDKLMRTLAEYDNYRKRSQRERMEIYPDAVAATVAKLLPVLDNFDRAMQTPCADAEFKKGMEMIFNSFQECLKVLNVEEIEAQGKPFDPNLHNAVMHTEDEAFAENTVAQVMQKGYKIGDRVLRHAMVQVAN